MLQLPFGLPHASVPDLEILSLPKALFLVPSGKLHPGPDAARAASCLCCACACACRIHPNSPARQRQPSDLAQQPLLLLAFPLFPLPLGVTLSLLLLVLSFPQPGQSLSHSLSLAFSFSSIPSPPSSSSAPLLCPYTTSSIRSLPQSPDFPTCISHEARLWAYQRGSEALLLRLIACQQAHRALFLACLNAFCVILARILFPIRLSLGYTLNYTFQPKQRLHAKT